MDSRPGMADHITCIPFTLSAFVNSLPGQKPTPKKNPISVKWAPHSRNENIYGHPSAKLGTFQTHRDARQCRESSGVAHVEFVTQNILIIAIYVIIIIIIIIIISFMHGIYTHIPETNCP